MPNQVRVNLQGISKTYEIWTNPLARLKSPFYQRAAHVAQRVNCNWLSQKLRTRAGLCVEHIEALKPVSIEVRAGEAFGILGRNGSGKSTLLQIATGTLRPSSGRVEVQGRISALLQLGSGFNPDFTGRENVFLNAAILGVTRAEAKRRFDEVLEFAEVGDFIDYPLRTYSSGMQMRLAFAVQVMLDPDVLIIDEALAVGDIFFQQKCFSRLKELLARGTCVLFVSHSVDAVQQFCDRALVLDRGSAAYIGDAAEAVKRYQVITQKETTNAASVHTPEDRDLPHNHNEGKTLIDESIPPADTWIHVLENQQVGTGNAWVRQFAMSDSKGHPATGFYQGEWGYIWYKIEAIQDIVSPSMGVAICTRRGDLVHAKHLVQTQTAGPSILRAGETIIVRQAIQLSLNPDEYTVEAAIISVPHECWEGDQIDEHRFNELIIRHAWTRPIMSLHVSPFKERRGHFLTHYGLVDLQGEIDWKIQPGNQAPDPMDRGQDATDSTISLA